MHLGAAVLRDRRHFGGALQMTPHLQVLLPEMHWDATGATVLLPPPEDEERRCCSAC